MLDYKQLKEVDLKLLLLGGSKIKVGNLEVEPYTIGEIRDYGYTRYMESLQWISLSIDDFISSITDIEKREIIERQRDKLRTFDFYTKIGGREFLEGLIISLSAVFKTDDVRILDDGVIVLNFEKQGIVYKDENGNLLINPDKLDSLNEDEIMAIHRDNFDTIVEVIKLQNYLTRTSERQEDDGNPVDEETRALIEHRNKMRAKVEASKKKQAQMESGSDGEIDISDIISAVSSKSNSINKLNVWELTLYQLYDEYARLELIDNYDFSIKAMMAGAEKIDLKHWSSKI